MKLKFLDMKHKMTFETDVYKQVKKGNRMFAVATSPKGTKCWRFMKK